MSDPNPISIYPDSAEQSKRIAAQARKHDVSVSEYCLMAIEQRIARETKSDRLEDLDIETPLEDLQADITGEIEDATAVSGRQDFPYEIALWELLSSEYSPEERKKA